MPGSITSRTIASYAVASARQSASSPSPATSTAAPSARRPRWIDLPALALSGWAGGALAALEFAGVRGETVLCPSNTFAATALATLHAGARVEFVDCNRDDLCVSFADFERQALRHRPRAAW